MPPNSPEDLSTRRNAAGKGALANCTNADRQMAIGKCEPGCRLEESERYVQERENSLPEVEILETSGDIEIERIRHRYERRAIAGVALGEGAYCPLNADVNLSWQEKVRRIIGCFKQYGLTPVAERTILDIGCGNGSDLLEFIRLGFQPNNLVGVDLIEDHARVARQRLPAAVRLLVGNASQLNFPHGSFDVVYQSTVFTSILDPNSQQRLAAKMWELTKTGGGVLWYDFVYDNPRNQDVKGVALDRIRSLFPEGRIRCWKITLAPPISRVATRTHPSLYTLLNTIQFLRTHLLCWIQKS
jgi:SAM-dependent methyltransferase